MLTTEYPSVVSTDSHAKPGCFQAEDKYACKLHELRFKTSQAYLAKLTAVLVELQSKVTKFGELYGLQR